MKDPLFEAACRIVELEDGDIALQINIYPFKDIEQASDCAEHIREAFNEKVVEFFEQDAGEIISVPGIIRGRLLS